MDLVRRIIYTPKINKFIRSCLKPFRRFLPKKAQIPVSGIIKIDTLKYGSIKMCTNQTNCLTKEIFWNGIYGYEYPTLRIFMELIKTKSVFIDVGSNIGYYSLIAANINPQIKIWAFEPMPSAYLFLKRNIKLNNMNKNITPVQVAVADKKGVAQFFITRNPKALFSTHHIGGSSSTAKAKDNYSQNIHVSTESLDNFARKNKIAHVDVIKLDTEATEDRVLAGAKKIIERDLPIILCEVLPGRIEEKLEKFYLNHDYDFFLPRPSGLEKIKTLKGHATEKDYLFIHKSKLNQVKSFLIKP